jgi:formylglycine-generating enzyme required for sulfatase activity
VGVTKQQAEAFCAWRSSIVTENYNREGKGLARKYHVEITFRLPTEKEWEILAQGKNTNPHGFKQLNKKEHSKIKNGDNKMYWQEGERVNCKMPYDDSITSPDSYEGKIRYLEYIKTNSPTDYLLYNTIGNVAEMVQEEGIAKGGSWFHTLEESAIKERQIYTKPTAWLGFRCVATVKLTPKK